MHQSAMENAKRFFEHYGKYLDHNKEIKIVEIGSQNVNGTIRDAVPKHLHVKYIGADLTKGKGVDVVLSDPYKLPFESEYADIVYGDFIRIVVMLLLLGQSITRSILFCSNRL